jgi:branched-subunit amino acid transport protein
MSAWIAVLVAGVISYSLRVGPVALLTHYDSPLWMDRASDLIGPVAFAALAGSALASATILPAATVPMMLAAGAPKLVGASLGAVAAYRFRSPWAAIAVGLPTMLTLKAVIAG